MCACIRVSHTLHGKYERVCMCIGVYVNVYACVWIRMLLCVRVRVHVPVTFCPLTPPLPPPFPPFFLSTATGGVRVLTATFLNPDYSLDLRQTAGTRTHTHTQKCTHIRV